MVKRTSWKLKAWSAIAAKSWSMHCSLLLTLISIIICEWSNSLDTCQNHMSARNIAKNYHVLSNEANMSRTWAKVILEWLKESYKRNTCEALFGFRRNHTITCAIFLLKSIINKYNDTNIIALYIDLIIQLSSLWNFIHEEY